MHKVIQGGAFDSMEVHESVICKPKSTKFFSFGIYPFQSTCHAIFLYVSTTRCVTPEQVTGYLIHNGTIGFEASTGSLRYILQASEQQSREPSEADKNAADALAIKAAE